MARFGVTIRPTSRLVVFEVKAPFSVDGIEVSPEGGNLAITKTVEADEIDQAEKRVKKWARLLTAAFAVQSGRHLRFEVTGAREIPQPGQASVRMSTSVRMIASLVLPLDEGAMKEAIRLVPILESLPRDDLCKRAAHWYARGIADRDPVDRFIDHWIALETLSGMHQGDVEPYRCPECGRVLNVRPSGATVREFLRSLGLGDRLPLVKGLARVRARLFHTALAAPDARAKSGQLAEIVRDVLLKLLHDRRSQAEN